MQVSRWDRLKDMPGVLQGFADFVVSDHDTQLVLAGPVVSAVTDDPEGAQVLSECWEAWRRLPHHARSRVALACLPMADVEENAVIVNALQRHAAIVVQKSLAEGFGLTVSEAMFKRRPVVASAVGGIADQIIDGESGILLRDPTDLGAFAGTLADLLADPSPPFGARRSGTSPGRRSLPARQPAGPLERAALGRARPRGTEPEPASTDSPQSAVPSVDEQHGEPSTRSRWS